MLATAAAVLAGLAAGAGPAQEPSCSGGGTSAWTTAALADWVSFSDQVAVIAVLAEKRSPPPDGPEGYAGLIGRRVTVLIEETLWRRRGAPRAPERFTFTDWGWSGTVDDPRPIRVCDGARLEVGRHYLAPLTRRGEWFAWTDGRLLLDGDRVVGGVDGGEPTFAHHELAGRSVEAATRVVKRAAPYRAAVRHRRLRTSRRWNEVDRDRYRLAGGRPANVTVAAGVTDRARWALYGRRGGLCLGIRTRGLWGGSGGSGETCGGRPTPRRKLVVGFFSSARSGAFAYGRTWPTGVEVVVRFRGEPAVRADTVPRPPGLSGHERYWVVPARGDCTAALVRALDIRGREIARVELPPGRLGSGPGC